MEDNALVLSIILLVVFGFMLFLLEWRRNQRLKAQERKPVSIDDIMSEKGEPDEIFVINPLLGSRSDGVVLLYKEKGVIVVNGEGIPVKNVTDVSFSNYANAYLPSDYVVQIFTNLPGKDIIRIPTGSANSPVFAKEIVQQIRSHVFAT